MEATLLKDLNILVVDDEDTLRETIAKALKRRGAQVFTAPNGTEAFNLIKMHELNFVISDIRMPEGDGMALLQSIQSHTGPKPKVILISGYSEITREEALKRGAVELLAKPFSRDRMLEVLLKNK